MTDINAISSIDDGEQIRQDVNKVTEEAVKRIQASSAQAKKIQADIKQDKQDNNDIARFLEFLLKNIKDDDLVAAVYKTFYTVSDHKTGRKYIRKKLNNILIVGFFAPFFVNEINEFGLSKYYRDILPSEPINLDKYVSYIKNLSKKHHDNIPISKSNLMELLIAIVINFSLSHNVSSSDAVKNEILAKFH